MLKSIIYIKSKSYELKFFKKLTILTKISLEITFFNYKKNIKF